MSASSGSAAALKRLVNHALPTNLMNHPLTEHSSRWDQAATNQGLSLATGPQRFARNHRKDTPETVAAKPGRQFQLDLLEAAAAESLTFFSNHGTAYRPV